MERKAEHQLLQWKDSRNRKPLLIYGARQVGKTWLMKKLGEKVFENTLYVNFEKEILRDDIIIDYYLDRDIREKATSELNHVELEDIEPLLVNSINTWSLRPTADCFIPNLFFVSDYVRTNTDLATMEGANEAARRAVNCILEKSGSTAEDCEIWDLEEPFCFELMKWYDKQRYKKGLPWSPKIPSWIKGLTFLMGIFYFVGAIFKALVSGKGELDPGSKKEKIFIPLEQHSDP